MLLHLSIENLAIIDRLALDFAEGFSCLTGETGAGKSIIIGALNLVLGERASSSDVRSGCESAYVEALFDVSAHPRVQTVARELNVLASDDAIEQNDLIVRREVNASGRSRCLVNGRLLPLHQLRRLGDLLVDLHGQHQHQSLLNVEVHRELLDLYGGDGVREARDAYAGYYTSHRAAVRKLRSLNRDEREMERQKDILEYQLREIAQAALEPGEDEALEQERQRLEHAETLGRAALGANDLILEGETQDPTVTDMLTRAGDELSAAAELDKTLAPLVERLENARAELVDIAESLRDYAADLEHDPQRLAFVQDRLHAIRQLKRKYGASIEDILQAAAKYEAELETLTHSREEQERLEQEILRLEKELARAADRLTERRREAGDRFAAGLRENLSALEMPKVRFEVRIERRQAGKAASPDGEDDVDDAGDDDFESDRPLPAGEAAQVVRFPDGRQYEVHEHGADRIEFLISPNAGEEVKPLRRIASGGELSRIMLALKALMANQEGVPTLVFDEIDTGISGRTGTRIGREMARLAESRQVICITHLPQIAARATRHFTVTKASQKGRTLTRVQILDEDSRLDEIARLLGGEADSEIARRHAHELLTAAGAENR